MHAVDIFWARLRANEQDALAVARAFDCFFRGKREFACDSSRACTESSGERDHAFFVLRVKVRQQKFRQLARGNTAQRRLHVDKTFLHHLDSDAYCCVRSSLASACLQHEEFAVFNGELNVLHLLVVLLKLGADLHEMRESLREFNFHLRDRLGRSNTCNHIFALRVYEEVAVEHILASGVVARERNASTGICSHVAVRHRLHIDRGAVESGDAFDAAILDRLVTVPRTEHRLDREFKLQHRVLREGSADFRLVDLLVCSNELDESFGGHIGVFLHAVLRLDRTERVFKLVLSHIHHDLAEHVNESAVRVVRKARISRAFRESFHSFIGEAEIQHRVHHARHRHRCTRTNRDEQRVRDRTELLAEFLLEHRDVLAHIIHQALREFPAAVVIGCASIRGDGEARRNRKTDRHHVRKIRALATEEQLLPHMTFALRFTEVVNHLRALCRCLLCALLHALRHQGACHLE